MLFTISDSNAVKLNWSCKASDTEPALLEDGNRSIYAKFHRSSNIVMHQTHPLTVPQCGKPHGCNKQNVKASHIPSE